MGRDASSVERHRRSLMGSARCWPWRPPCCSNASRHSLYISVLIGFALPQEFQGFAGLEAVESEECFFWAVVFRWRPGQTRATQSLRHWLYCLIPAVLCIGARFAARDRQCRVGAGGEGIGAIE